RNLHGRTCGGLSGDIVGCCVRDRSLRARRNAFSALAAASASAAPAPSAFPPLLAISVCGGRRGCASGARHRRSRLGLRFARRFLTRRPRFALTFVAAIVAPRIFAFFALARRLRSIDSDFARRRLRQRLPAALVAAMASRAIVLHFRFSAYFTA